MGTNCSKNMILLTHYSKSKVEKANCSKNMILLTHYSKSKVAETNCSKNILINTWSNNKYLFPKS